MKNKVSIGLLCGCAMLLYLTLFCSQASAQQATHSIAGQFFLPTIHLSKKAIEFGEKYSYKLSADGRVLWSPGVNFFYNYRLPQNWLKVEFVRFSVA